MTDLKRVQPAGDSIAIAHAPPAVLGCGLHDLRRLRPTGAFQQPIQACRRNLQALFARLAPLLPGRVVWVTITPVLFERHRRNKEFDRRPADVAAYNETALEVVQPLGVRVLDLHRVVERGGVEECLGEDGVHMSERGNRLLAEAAARAVREAVGRRAR